MSACLFCRIVNREIPADVVYEDDRILAFRDIFPQAPVHVLIIPKAHREGLNDLTPDFEGVLGRIPFVAAQIAREQGCASTGYRMLTNSGANAGQTVFHLHFHLMGGKELGGKLCQ